MKFEIGDSVRVINSKWLEGYIGIIRYAELVSEIDKQDDLFLYAVEFFDIKENINVSLHDCGNRIPSGNGYWFEEHSLEPITTNINSDCITISKFERKEENKMNCNKILNLYREREMKNIEESYRHQKIDILKKDELYTIASEMIEQMNIILEDDGQTDRVQVLSDSPRYLTKETKELLEDLEKNIRKERIQLHETLDEVSAMLEIALDYNEAMKILERYEIIDKKTKKIVND